ncbi:MAG: response regulator transcription factor [Proteobacteria bacterium]|nr:response regulator transcription factor [Pseudomonadota bacterium]MCP4915988.1 response regulator transcription factor [Pseudomonadota bacterium]
MNVATILIVDDEQRIRRGVRRQLERAGHTVHDAGSVAEGLSALRHHRVDLVITDLEMPKLGGLDLLRELPKYQRLVPAIVLTGRPSLNSAVLAMRLSAIDYLTKPAPDLVERVDEALKRGSERAEAFQSKQALHEWERFIDEAQSRLTALRGRKPEQSERLDQLSSRETEVFQHLVRGLSAQQVGDELHISPHTARNHMKSIFKKLDVSSQLDLIARYGA